MNFAYESPCNCGIGPGMPCSYCQSSADEQAERDRENNSLKNRAAREVAHLKRNKESYNQPNYSWLKFPFKVEVVVRIGSLTKFKCYFHEFFITTSKISNIVDKTSFIGGKAKVETTIELNGCLDSIQDKEIDFVLNHEKNLQSLYKLGINLKTIKQYLAEKEGRK